MKILSVKIVIIAVVAYLIIGAISFHFIENRTWVDSFYFATSTVSTVGYGDVTPQTETGKLFTIFYILIGVSITAYAFSVIGSYLIKYHLEKSYEDRTKNEVEKVLKAEEQRKL